MWPSNNNQWPSNSHLPTTNGATGQSTGSGNGQVGGASRGPNPFHPGQLMQRLLQGEPYPHQQQQAHYLTTNNGVMGQSAGHGSGQTGGVSQGTNPFHPGQLLQQLLQGEQLPQQEQTQYLANGQSHHAVGAVPPPPPPPRIPPPPGLPHPPRGPPQPPLPPQPRAQPPTKGHQFYCDLCKVSCPNDFSFQQHMKGARHRSQRALLGGDGSVDRTGGGRVQPSPFHCALCDVTCGSELDFQGHLRGERHQKKTAFAAGESCPPANMPPVQHVSSEEHERNATVTINAIAQMRAEKDPRAHYCEICSISCPNEYSYQQHLEGEKHKRKLGIGSTKPRNVGGGKPAPKPVECEVCRVTCPNQFSYEQHMNSEKHKRKVANQSNRDPWAGKRGRFYCPICNVSPPNEFAYQGHLNGKTHARNVMNAAGKPGDNSNTAADNSLEPPSPSSPPQSPPDHDPDEGDEHEVKEIRPLISKASVDSESDEEGEIDEENEDITNLYDEFEEAAKPITEALEGDNVDLNSNGLSAPETEAKDSDSDVDDMFGGDENSDGEMDDEATGTLDLEGDDGRCSADGDRGEGHPVHDEAKGSINGMPRINADNVGAEGQSSVDDSPVDDNIMGSIHGTEDLPNERVASRDEQDMFGDDGDASHEEQIDRLDGNLQLLEEADIGRSIDNEGTHELDREQRSSGPVDDEYEDSAVYSEVSNRFLRQMQQNFNGERRLGAKVVGEDDACDLFRSNDKSCVQPTAMSLPNNSTDLSAEKQEDMTALDSGLGFVLDYQPDVLIDNNESKADEPETNIARDPKPPMEPQFVLNHQPAEPNDDHKEPPVEPPAEVEVDEEMFGGSSDDEEEERGEEMPLAATAQKGGSGTPVTAAEALAAARSRAKTPTRQRGWRGPAKLAKTTTLERQIVGARSPRNVPSFYPALNRDKYWSEIRDWDFIKELNDSTTPSSMKRESGVKRSHSEDDANPLPNVFESVSQYKARWAPLLINEAKAQLLSEAVAQSSWAQGVMVKVELSRTARDLSTFHDNVSTLEPTVVVYISSAAKGARNGSPVAKDDLILFVRHPPIIARALRGKAFESNDDDTANLQKLPQGRLGFVGRALNHRSRAIDGLLVRVSQKHWSQFSSLGELFLVKIGSNVTALREFNALSRIDEIPLSNFILDGKASAQSETDKSKRIVEPPRSGSSEKYDPLSVGSNALPVGFRIFIKSKMNASQLHAITASASEYGEGGFTLVKGPPGTGKSTTLCSILNALHLKQYQDYYSAIEKIVTESNCSSHYEELAALNRAAEVKPRILVCAPSNAGIDNVLLKIMADRFVDGQGTKYSPNIVRVGAGTTNSKVRSVGLQEQVASIIAQGSDVTKLEGIIANGRRNLKRYQHEIHKLRIRIQALMDAVPYPFSSDWEARIDEPSFDSGKVLFVNHATKTTTFDIPPKVRPHEQPCVVQKMPHYVSLLASLTKYVERFNNESAQLEKFIIVQNEATARMEAGGAPDDSLNSLLETHVLNSTHIVLTTLGSAGGRAMDSANKFKVVVIDEAAQSAEPSTLVALQLGSRHAILVGDPNQLPATIFSVSGRSTKYDRSLFQRLEESGHEVHLLNTQYRMNPSISDFPRHIFYKGMLFDGPNVKQSDFGGTLKTMINIKLPNFKPFNVLDLDSTEERDGTGLSNKTEAQLVLQLYRTLDRETNGLVAKTRVAVITPYSQQKALLNRLFEAGYGASYTSRVEISTVDAFQGRESGIVIYSCVRAGSGGSGIGFLADVQRMNVALTRAKHFLFIIARRRSIVVNPYWRQLVAYAKRKHAIIQVPMKRKAQSKTLRRSSLVKSASKKKVSFGGVRERTFEVNSQVPASAEVEEGGNLFPDLTSLTPMHMSSSDFDAASDSECSA